VNPYVGIDLGKPIKIYIVTVAVMYVRKETEHWDSHIQVRIGNDTDITKNLVCTYLGDTAKQASGFISCDEPIVGRYVSAQRMNNLNTHFRVCEMRAFTMVPIPTEPTITRDACFQEKDAGTGSESLTRYYFNEPKCECKDFTYKGEGGSANNFETLEACQALCTEWEPPARCFQDQDVGTGGGKEILYYYNSESNKCWKLNYQGQGGNDNKFASKIECRNLCKRC